MEVEDPLRSKVSTGEGVKPIITDKTSTTTISNNKDQKQDKPHLSYR